MRRFFVIILVLVLAIVAVRIGYGRYTTYRNNTSGLLRITTSFYPLYYFASTIAGSSADVVNITPTGVEPHDYELTPGDIRRIEESDVVFINGGIEQWAANVTTKRLITTSKTVMVENDPHVWLDPLLSIQLVNTITDALVLVNPSQTAAYRSRSEALIAELDELDSVYRQALKGCRQRTLVTSHSAWGYLAKRYGLTQVPIAGLNPDQEPAAKDLSLVVKAIRANNVDAVFFEALTDPKLAKAVASETGAQLLELNPLEGLSEEQMRSGATYFTIQKENLDHLKQGLLCQ